MEFPHLKETEFPLINNVDVYKYQNNFDYSRWTGKITFKLINVLWNSDYTNVPYFENESKRDEWFNSQQGFVGALESAFNITPKNLVRVPIPYNEAYKYNYLVVDTPLQTSSTNLINYENKDLRISKWFYFIENITQYAPNVSELEIVLDVWTTFIYTVNIPYLMLERGHAPMFETDVETYLNNPILNNEFLLADDFNFGNEINVIQTTNYIPIGNGKKYILFCAPYDSAEFNQFGGSSYSGESTPPTYANIDARWGYQLQVNDYQWRYGDSDYSQANIPVKNAAQEGVLNGCRCFAILGEQAQAFFNDCAKYCVNFIHGIKAMFMLDESLFTKGSSFTFRNYTIYNVEQKFDSQDFTFTKEQFGFDEKYQNITKLYTYPYSELEIIDDNGVVKNCRIENCGDLKINSEVSIVFPFLNYNIFVSGINGAGELPYVWKKLDGSIVNKNMWASDFNKYMFNWNIPIYSIFVSAKNEFASKNYFANKAKRAGAIKDYQNSVRFGNTTSENTIASVTTNKTNVDDLETTKANNVARTTAKDVANVERDNTMRNNIGSRENSRDTALNTIANTLLDSTTATARNRLLNDSAVDLLLIDAGVNADAERTTLTAVSNTVGSVISGGLSGGVAGAAMGAISGLTNGVSSAIGFGIDAEYARIQKHALVNKVERLAGNTQYGNGGITEIRDANKTSNNDSTAETNNARYGTNTSIVSYTNAAAYANQSATETAENTNANNLKTSNINNAERTKNTESNNATQQRNANVEAEKANLAQKQLEAESQYLDAKLNVPITYSEYKGDFASDIYKRRGIRLNIRTQTKSAISQTGDCMLRFGYALNKVWDMANGFHYGKHFTYWKAIDVWINCGNGVLNSAISEIRNILMNGVTVWKNPDEIGKVSIYSNI